LSGGGEGGAGGERKVMVAITVVVVLVVEVAVVDHQRVAVNVSEIKPCQSKCICKHFVMFELVSNYLMCVSFLDMQICTIVMMKTLKMRL
jgi:hypothetical protein